MSIGIGFLLFLRYWSTSLAFLTAMKTRPVIAWLCMVAFVLIWPIVVVKAALQTIHQQYFD